MEEDLVSQGSDSEMRKGAVEDSSSLISYLYECLPVFMSIGMPMAEYWEGDGDLVIYYRKAEELRQERLNWQLHLQGMYVYEAICCASPIFNPLVKKAKPIPYRSLPYGVEEKEHIDKTAQTKKAMDVFLARVTEFNKSREETLNAGSESIKTEI